MIAFASAIALIAAAQIADQKPYPLIVGDPAPKLTVSGWAQGEPVKAFAKGKVYVVDFWSTWCGPCIESMPKLSALQLKHGDRIAVIGVDVWDYQERVPAFIKEMGPKLSYRVALDQLPPIPANEDNVPMWAKANGVCAKSWLQASGADGIPTVFVVDKQGRIAWIGHDIAELEKVVESTLADKWDLEARAAEHKSKMERRIKVASARTQMFAAMGRRHWEEALNQAEILRGFEPAANPGAYFEILAFMGRKTDAYRIGEEMIRGDDANALHQLAHLLTFTLELRAEVDLAIANRMAIRSNELSKGERGATLEVLARNAWLRGEKQKAIDFQRTAIANTTGAAAKDRAEKRLKDYEGG